MATAASLPSVSLDEYLHTVYRPDVDYVDGHIEERNLGEYEHGDLQAELVTFFRNHSREWKLRTVVETRVQVRERNFRVPDVCVTEAGLPREQIIRHPPLLCLEVLSPEDTAKRVRVRVRDFLAMGVRAVWVFDPARRVVTVWDATGETSHASGILTLDRTPIRLDVAAIFSVLEAD
jgi:Uma2 family endonuclease